MSGLLAKEISDKLSDLFEAELLLVTTPEGIVAAYRRHEERVREALEEGETL